MNQKYLTLFFAFTLPILYFFLYAPYGFSDTDDGFILGNSYRVFNGELPYRDFFYVRPPLSLYIHSISFFFVPENYIFLFERFLLFFFISLYSYISLLILENHFEELQKNIFLKNIFLLLTFMFSVHNFPPMPWHTVDGILLSVIGIFFLDSKNVSWNGVLGAFFLFLAALTKQSFYPMIFIGLIYLYLFNKDSLKLYIVTLISLTIMMAVALNSFNLFELFVSQTTGQTTFSDLYIAGIRKYLIPLLCVIAITLVYSFYLKKIVSSRLVRYSLVGIITIVFLIDINHLLNQKEFISNYLSYSQCLFAIAFIYAIFILRKNSFQKMTIILVLLSISWCSSISWGYQMPLLYSAPMIFIFVYFLKQVNISHMTFIFILLMTIITFWLHYYFPYLDNSKNNLIYHMGSIFPKLNGIYSDYETFQKYKELKELQAKYGESFITLPSVSLSHYLTNTKNPIGIDWALNAEINYNYHHLLKQINQSKIYIFVENNSTTSKHGAGRYGSILTEKIIENFKIIEKKEHFTIYQAI